MTRATVELLGIGLVAWVGLTALSALCSSRRQQAQLQTTIRSADLKPLFDFAQDRRVCRIQLQNVQQNQVDNSIKLTALVTQRDRGKRSQRGIALTPPEAQFRAATIGH
jgi:hypothetical protein